MDYLLTLTDEQLAGKIPIDFSKRQDLISLGINIKQNGCIYLNCVSKAHMLRKRGETEKSSTPKKEEFTTKPRIPDNTNEALGIGDPRRAEHALEENSSTPKNDKMPRQKKEPKKPDLEFDVDEDVDDSPQDEDVEEESSSSEEEAVEVPTRGKKRIPARSSKADAKAPIVEEDSSSSEEEEEFSTEEDSSSSEEDDAIEVPARRGAEHPTSIEDRRRSRSSKTPPMTGDTRKSKEMRSPKETKVREKRSSNMGKGSTKKSSRASKHDEVAKPKYKKILSSLPNVIYADSEGKKPIRRKEFTKTIQKYVKALVEEERASYKPSRKSKKGKGKKEKIPSEPEVKDKVPKEGKEEPKEEKKDQKKEEEKKEEKKEFALNFGSSDKKEDPTSWKLMF